MVDAVSVCEYQKICRICLKNDILVSIYSPTFLVRPIEMLEKLNILKVAPDNALPGLLCQSCLYRLLDAYNLQQLAAASERRLREYFGLPASITSTCGGSSILSCGDLVNIAALPNAELIKADTDYSSASMYANICDMFDGHDVTNDMVEVVGTDDVELLNDVEIDVSNLTRSEAEESLNDVFMSKSRLTIGNSQLLSKNLEHFKIQQQNNPFTIKAFNTDKSTPTIKKSQNLLKKCLKKSLTPLDKCLECGKVFHYKGYLEIHKRIHTGDKPFKCQICSREFITSNKLLLHRRTHNNHNINESYTTSSTSSLSAKLSERKRFQCEICSALFTTSSNLKSHKFTHSTKREYQCNICLVAFKSPRDLKRHEPVHKTIKDVHCMMCEKSFTKRASLNAHLITVHNRVRKHKCTDCDKIFGKRSNLINHIRIHSGEKPFACTSCSWKFSQSSALKRHMKKHEKMSVNF